MAVDVKRGAIYTRICLCKKKENVAPVAAASFVKIFKMSKKKHAQAKETFVIQGLLEKHSDNTC